MKRIDIKIEKEIINFYKNEQKSTVEISKIYNISSTVVRNILIRNNIKIRNISESKKGKKIGRKLPVFDIIRLYVEENKPSTEISKILGCSKRSILNILIENNIERRKSGWPEKYKHPLTDLVIKEYKNGRGMPFLSKKLNISYGSIRKILKKNNLIRTEEKNFGGGKYNKGRKWTEENRDNVYIGKTGVNFDEYLKRLPVYIRYRKLVTYYTNKQELNLLENFNLRGKKSYHLDHKFSVMVGFKNNINPELIGNINNLAMLRYDENIRKHDNCNITLEELLMLTENKITPYWVC